MIIGLWNGIIIKKEENRITFEIDGEKIDNHTFRIFTIDEVKQCCENVGLIVLNVYENYDVNKGWF